MRDRQKRTLCETGPPAPGAHQEKHAETWGYSRLVGWPAYPRAIVIPLFTFDRQAPLLIERSFPRSPAAYGPLDVLRPKAAGDSFFGGTPADVGPGREKRPEPLEHHRDNSGDRGNESAVLPLNYRPNPMEGEVSLLKR